MIFHLMHKASWGWYIFACQGYDSRLYFYVPFHIIALLRIKCISSFHLCLYFSTY